MGRIRKVELTSHDERSRLVDSAELVDGLALVIPCVLLIHILKRRKLHVSASKTRPPRKFQRNARLFFFDLVPGGCVRLG